MYKVEEVEMYEVNGYTVMSRGKKELEDYLSEVPKNLIKSKEYEGKRYLILTERDAEVFKCKELQHMKFNDYYDSKEMAEIKITTMEHGLLENMLRN